MIVFGVEANGKSAGGNKICTQNRYKTAENGSSRIQIAAKAKRIKNKDMNYSYN